MKNNYFPSHSQTPTRKNEAVNVPSVPELLAMRNVSSGVIYYYEDDMLGSARTMVQAGQTSPCYDGDFYPFGGERIITNTCAQNYKFEGKERDTETGNDDFGARYYSSRLGRWLSADWSDETDPVPYADLEDPQTLNLYAFVRNNPLSVADVDGHHLVCGPDTYSKDEQGNVVVTSHCHEVPDLLLAVALGTRMAEPGVNLAFNGLRAFGYMVAPPLMAAADCAAGAPSCTKSNVALSLIPGLPELKGLGLALKEETAITGVLKQIAEGTTEGKEFLNTTATLPAKSAGYYREFTVPVAGQAGRGAARLVTGAGGEIYYTADHYLTFTRIK